MNLKKIKLFSTITFIVLFSFYINDFKYNYNNKTYQIIMFKKDMKNIFYTIKVGA